MTEIIKCDSCGDIAERATLMFGLHPDILQGDEYRDPEGNYHGWDHDIKSGDLCSECAEPVIEQLNEVLGDD